MSTVGRLYLDLTPRENDSASLLAFLPDADTVDDKYWDTFEEQLRRDFRTGETVSIDGWVLARSECRLYGLLYLLVR
jgi:hypothetical protein